MGVKILQTLPEVYPRRVVKNRISGQFAFPRVSQLEWNVVSLRGGRSCGFSVQIGRCCGCCYYCYTMYGRPQTMYGGQREHEQRQRAQPGLRTNNVSCFSNLALKTIFQFPQGRVSGVRGALLRAPLHHSRAPTSGVGRPFVQQNQDTLRVLIP